MNRKNHLMISLVAITTLAVSPTFARAETPKTGAPTDTVLAKINGTEILVDDFSARYKENLKFFQFKAPSKKEVLEDIIKRELAIQEAKKLGLDRDPVVVERINTVLFQALLDKQLSKDLEKIVISDDDAKTRYTKSPEIRTSHLFVQLAPDANAEQQKAAKKRIDDMQEALKKGASFAELAQTKSDGPAAPMGGDIDYKTKESLDPAYYSAALALGKAGRVSGVVKTPFGYHIIKLTAVRSWDDADRGQVKRQIFEERRASLFEKYMAKLRQEGKVSINSALLKD